MNKNYTSIIVLLTILFFGTLSAQETQKNFINYQGVARNASNELMISENMNITIGVKFGAANTAAIYEESHTITTDANGVFSLLIGNGSSLSGNYNTLPWGSAATFVTVSMNGNEIGTTEMMAVPYAISSGDADNQTAVEVPYDNSSSGLSATNAQEAIDELITSGSTDADSDPTNEFQMLSFDTATNELSLSDGNTITIPSGGTDADADPTNEIQTISFDAASNKISLTDGGEITIPSGGTDADADPANELQDISLVGTELSITDGSTIDFAPIIPADGTDNQELTFNETTRILEIEDGNTVDLSSLSGGSGSSLWSEDEDGISRRTGVVGIGHQASLTAKLFVQNSTEGIRNGIRSDVFNPGFKVGISSNARSNDDENTFGMRATVTSEASATSWGYRSDMIGAGTGTKYGFYSRLTGGTGTKYGIYTDGEDRNYFSGDVGVGTEFPTAKLDIDGSIRARDLSGTGQRNVMADADGNLVIGSGGGTSSLWSEDANGINYSSGNVGIGNTSSIYPLNISTDNERPVNLSSTGSNTYMAFNNSGGYKGYAGIFTGDSDMDFGTGFLNLTGKVHLVTNAAPKLTVAADGDVGIGTTTPTARLDVIGDIKTTGEVHSSATGSANMIPIAYGRIAADGNIEEGSGNFTINKIGTNYFIRIAGATLSDATEFSMVASRLGNSGPGFITTGFGVSGGVGSLIINTFNIDGDAAEASFSFVVYQD